MSSDHKKSPFKLEKPPTADEIADLKKTFDKGMKILEQAVAHLKELEHEVETMVKTLTTFIDEVNTAIDDVLLNYTKTAYENNAACKEADFVLRSIQRSASNLGFRLVHPKRVRNNLSVVNEKLKELLEQEDHGKVEELQEGNKEATEKAKKIDAFVKAVDTAREKVRSQFTSTSDRPENEVYTKADRLVSKALDEWSFDLMLIAEGVKQLKKEKAVKAIIDEYSWANKFTEREEMSKDWNDAHERRDAIELRSIIKKVKVKIDSFRNSDYTQNLVLSLEKQ